MISSSIYWQANSVTSLLHALGIDTQVRPPRYVLVFNEVAQHGSIRGQLFAPLDHICHGTHILRTRDRERRHKCVVHWVVQNRVKRLIALVLKSICRVRVEDFANAEHPCRCTETRPETVVDVPEISLILLNPLISRFFSYLAAIKQT